jgi:hypothetical protein
LDNQVTGGLGRIAKATIYRGIEKDVIEVAVFVSLNGIPSNYDIVNLYGTIPFFMRYDSIFFPSLFI